MATSTTTRRRKSATTTPPVEKALVSVPAPRKPASIYVIGDGTEREFRVNPLKRDKQAVYYEMFKQHPTLRAGIEKIAKTAVANGYRFVPVDPTTELAKDRVRELTRFFRASNANQLLRLTYKDLIIYGEAYWLVVKTNSDRPIKALRLHPSYMDARLVNGQIAGWRYGPINESEDTIKYEADEVMQFKMDDPNSDVYGLSLLESLQHTIASDLFAMRFNKKFFENSASSGLILGMKGTSDEVVRNREWLEQNYVGTDNAYRPMILEGEIEVHEGIGNLDEMQFIEGRKFNRQEILSVLDIDPSKLGINEDSNRSTSKEADNTFRSETISPIQLVIEEEISNALILGMYGWDDILFEQNESSFRDKMDNAKLYDQLERMGVFSINDVLKELGRPTIDNGDEHFIQTAAGLIPVALVDEVANRLVIPTLTGGAGMGTGSEPGQQQDQQDQQTNA